MHENLCYEHGNSDTGWLSYKWCKSILYSKIRNAIKKKKQGVTFKEEYATNTKARTCDVTWKLENKGLQKQKGT